MADHNGLVFNCDGEYQLTDENGVAGLYQNYEGSQVSIPYISSTYPDGNTPKAPTVSSPESRFPPKVTFTAPPTPPSTPR